MNHFLKKAEEAKYVGSNHLAKAYINLTLQEGNSLCLPTMKKEDKEQVLLKDKNCSSWHISEAESKNGTKKGMLLAARYIHDCHTNSHKQNLQGSLPQGLHSMELLFSDKDRLE